MIEKNFIEDRLNELVPSTGEPLHEAARYSLLSSGKRIRPLLVLTTATAFGAHAKNALDPACAIEMIHTYSLIHDDLPSMDNDDLRRGKPTLHKVYPEGIAILAGDFLLTFAFELLSEAKGLTAEQRLDLVQTLARCAGAKGMIGGQVIDMGALGKEIDESTLEQMHTGKTSALLIACLEFGAIIANAHDKRELLRQIGYEAGLIYQIQDDILDETGTVAQLGKKGKGDLSRGKPNAVSLYGLSGAKQKLSHWKESLAKKMIPLPTSLQENLKTLLSRPTTAES